MTVESSWIYIDKYYQVLNTSEVNEASAQSEQLAPRREGQRAAFRQQDGVMAARVEVVAIAVGDDEDRAILRKVLRALQQIDAWLENGAAAAPHLHPAGDVFRTKIAGVVGVGIAEDHARLPDFARLAITGDRSQTLAKEPAVHRPRGVEHHAEGA